MSTKKQNWLYASILAAVMAILAFYANQQQQFNRRDPILSKRSGPIASSSEFLNVQKAAEYYRFRIRRDPGSIENYVRLAQLCLQEARITGRHHQYISQADRLLDEALRRIESELARRPNHLDVLETYAWLLYRDHRPAEAAPLIEQVMKTNRRSATLYYRAGMIALELGQHTQATEYLKTALAINPHVSASAMETAQQTLRELTRERARITRSEKVVHGSFLKVKTSSSP